MSGIFNFLLKNFPNLLRWFRFGNAHAVPIASSSVPGSASSNPINNTEILSASSSPSTLSQSHSLRIHSVPKGSEERTTSISGIPSARTIHTVNPHIPLVKFIGRRRQPHFIPDEHPAPLTAPPQPSLEKSESQTRNKPPIGFMTLRGSGIDESQLPLVFRRRFLEPEEIEAINAGGRYG